MIAFETVLLMLTAAVALLAIARRLGIPFPVLLALAGAGIALAPIRLPALDLNPALVLAVLVAPVLLDAAYDTSPRDLKRSWRPVLSLAFIAVGITTLAVAWVMHWLVPTIPFAACVAIGAIVAPPDAVAAMAVLRPLGLPHRISTILEGEALLNDAATLLIFRLAIAAVAEGGSIGAEAIAPAFLLSIVGSLIAGPALAWAWSKIIHRIDDVPSSIILQFVGAFGIWLIAERLALSPILTVVAFAMATARWSPARTPASQRIPSYAVWETVVVVLNVLAFLLIGLELGPAIAAAKPGDLTRWLVIGALVLATVIAVRLLWVGINNVLRQIELRGGKRDDVDDGLEPSWRTGLVIGWAGTRGIITVATALALPGNFPERSMMLFVAFAVTLGTLLIQGLTLKPLVLALKLSDDGPVDREVRLARVAMADAALAMLDGSEARGAESLRREARSERELADAADEGDARPTPPEKALRAEVLGARRQRLLDLREDGTIGEDAFHRLEEELDYADLATATRT